MKQFFFSEEKSPFVNLGSEGVNFGLNNYIKMTIYMLFPISFTFDSKMKVRKRK